MDSIAQLCSVLHGLNCSVLHGVSLPFERVGAIESEIGIITAASYSKDLSARFSYNLVKISYGKNHNFRGMLLVEMLKDLHLYSPPFL